MASLKTLIITLFFLPAAIVRAQGPHPLEPVDAHYRELGALPAGPAAERAWMDTLAFPEFSSALTYVLVTPHYLRAGEVEALTASLHIPANSSEQTRAELDYLLALQRARTPEQSRRVTFLANIGYWPHIDLLPEHPGYEANLRDLFFTGREVLGDDCRAGSRPHTAHLLRGVMRDMRIMEFTVKYRYRRARPYQLDAALEPMARMGSPAFASGHTLWAFLQAFLWSELVPARRAGFLAVAEEIRRSREIMGIHYPSDNEAARQLAHAMMRRYFDNPRFRKDLAAAAGEWR